ncbi:GNAT family N-acetyltransferase [Gracilimonas sp. Q87]|uniref:GNAT family N-acetyltransferase n=1 Tax=Gracilimonas sp. Q87 TaxID=3384766 RepID=UPI003984056E
MDLNIRRGNITDLTRILNIERTVFPVFQQSSRRTLKLSLRSNFQQVWLAECKNVGDTDICGILILYAYKKTLRIYSIATSQNYQGMGIGDALLKHAEGISGFSGFERISLEADAGNKKLINWYKKRGYEVAELSQDYYAEGVDAYKMVKIISANTQQSRIKNVIVTDDRNSLSIEVDNLEIVSSKDYITNKGLYSEKALRIFNLCNSYRYQSKGYYVSLLASAREHRAIPNVTNIRDLQNISLIKSLTEDIDGLIQSSFKGFDDNKLTLKIYFSKTLVDRYKLLANSLYNIFQYPLFQVDFERTHKWKVRKVRALSLNKIDKSEIPLIQQMAISYFKTKRYHRTKMKAYKYYLAILTDPADQHPPSNKKALKKLRSVAEDMGVDTEFITKDDFNRISEFDALFIRDTTNVNDYTYKFSRKAYAEGLAVIDDPWSILRCSNKVFLHESLKLNNIPAPATKVFMKGLVTEEELTSISLPIILKKPDSSFSMGVVKVKSINELEDSLNDMFKGSDLVIGQEFMISQFDWRIGVLDHKALFACKYYMAKNHWQIYNWNSTSADLEGNADTLPLDQVPDNVINTALKASKLMGDGLYGVDLKEVDGKVFVIEVNDNPNIDSGIEDKVLGEELYRKIINSFIKRIEVARNIDRYVSYEPDSKPNY